MNTQMLDLFDVADPSRHRAQLPVRHVDRTPHRQPRPARSAKTVSVVIVAALVSATSLIAVTALNDEAPRAAGAATGATPQAASTPAIAPIVVTIDHSVIASDATSPSDAETVGASIAAYER